MNYITTKKLVKSCEIIDRIVTYHCFAVLINGAENK